MKILVIGGTRFFGIQMVEALLQQGNDVTLATRGNTNNVFGDRVSYITIERTNPGSMKALAGKHFDVVIDKIAYCSNDIKYALDVVSCDKYIHMSSISVYKLIRKETVEPDYNPASEKLIWCGRTDFSYDEIKRQAENALFQAYSSQKSIAVRYPFVIGKDDYTKRLQFYIEHTIKGLPMNIDNIDCQMSFINSTEAGEFIAYLAGSDFTGAINGCSYGTISVREIINYTENKCGKKAIISPDGDNAPYNGTPEYSINTALAKAIGYKFSNLKDWIFDLIDYYISLYV